MRVNVVVNMLFMLLGCAAFTQNGTVTGVIKDAAEDTTLFRAKVILEGTSKGAYSNGMGVFTLRDVTPGTYTMRVTYLRKSYSESIEGVVVVAGQTTTQDVSLGQTAVKSKVVQLDFSEFVDEEDETALINETKDGEQVAVAIGAEEITKKGGGTVGAAVKAVSGVSVEGGKYANIRGLRGRYVKTILNGSEIPGLDPDRNAVQLDLFPTSFLSSIKVIKSFTPDLPGDFSGGVIDIRTKDAPDSMFVKVSVGSAINPQVHGNENFLTYEGGKTDWFGYDDGSRAMPSNVKTDIENGVYPSRTDVLIDRNGARNYITTTNRQFNPLMAPTTMAAYRAENGGGHVAPVDYAVNLTMGNRIHFKDSTKNRHLGYFLGFNYKRSFSFYEDGTVALYELRDHIDNTNSLTAVTDYRKNQSKDNVLIGGLASLNYKHSARSKYKLSYIHNHSGTNRTSFSQGTSLQDPGVEFRVTEMDYIQRAIDNVQLSGDHNSKSGLHKIDWLASGTLSSQEQPDYRVVKDELNPDGTYQFGSAGRPTRFYREMSEQNTDAKFNHKLMLRETDSSHFYLKYGVSNNLKQRDFTEIRVQYDPISREPDYNGNVNDYIAPENLGEKDNGELGLMISDALTAPRNSYTGFRSVTGAYVMTDLSITENLGFVGGVRYENTIMTVESKDETLAVTELKENDIMPSVAFNLKLVDGKEVQDKRDTTVYHYRDMQTRLAYNKTLARPTFREIAPYAVDDFIRGIKLVGNPNLVQSQIHNIDATSEYYPRAGELLTVSGFYKYFNKPIGLFSNPSSGGGGEFEWKNLEYAHVYGVEFEFKKKLDVISPKFKNFAFSMNLTLVQSVTPILQEELDQMRIQDPYRESTRPLAGQSPYLINSTLEYELEKHGISTNISFNMFGDRLAVYSGDATPDIYEKARPELNFNFSKKLLSDRLTLKLRVKNLLNPSYTLAYEYKGSASAYEKFEGQENYYRSFKKGTSYAVGLSYKF